MSRSTRYQRFALLNDVVSQSLELTVADIADIVHFSRCKLQRLSGLESQVRLAIELRYSLSLHDIRAFGSRVRMAARALARLELGNHTQYLVARREVDRLQHRALLGNCAACCSYKQDNGGRKHCRGSRDQGHSPLLVKLR